MNLWLKSKPLIRSAEQTKSANNFAVLIIDDSILEKPHTDQNAMISTYYDPKCIQERLVGSIR